MDSTPTVEEIRHAALEIKDYIHKTPVLTSSTIDGFASQTLGLNARLVFKCENFQKVGAFKIRGATYAIKRLLETTKNPRDLIVVTHSSGNHAQALALASRELDLLKAQCQIVMPSNTPKVKKDAVRGYGATITECEPTLEAREATVQAIIHRLQEEAKQEGQDRTIRLVHPYDDLDIIRGQGTIALELLGQANELGLPLDMVIAPVGGGGMLSGVAIASKGLVSKTLVFGAEPSGASDAQRSFRDKTFHPSVNPTTIADGLLTSLGKYTFPLILENVDDIFTVTDQEIAMAMETHLGKAQDCRGTLFMRYPRGRPVLYRVQRTDGRSATILRQAGQYRSSSEWRKCRLGLLFGVSLQSRIKSSDCPAFCTTCKATRIANTLQPCEATTTVPTSAKTSS